MNIYKTNNDKIKTFSKKKKKCKKEKDQIASYFDENGNRKQTGPEKKFEEFLIANNYIYSSEYKIIYDKYTKYYDFCIWVNINTLILIEIHGTHWHAKDYIDGKISKEKLTTKQKQNIRNDKKKIKIAKDLGIPLLIIWENEIKNCKTIVENFVKDYL